MRQRLRALGGPLHGKVQVVDRTSCYRTVVAPQMGCQHSALRACRPECYSQPIKQFEYEVRPVELGRNTRINVLAPADMTEDEMMRKLADIIEEVPSSLINISYNGCN